ncbi:hypothetical protein FH693_03615 [Streptococcus suis]|nr:hypothetical protein FH693_03615 [Streptococcus suis]
MKIKSSLGNEAEDRTGVHQGKVTTDNFDFRRVLKKERMALFLYIISFLLHRLQHPHQTIFGRFLGIYLLYIIQQMPY